MAKKRPCESKWELIDVHSHRRHLASRKKLHDTELIKG